MSPAAPAAPPELRLVLGAAAAGAGLALAPAGDPDVLDDAGAREAAAAWGLLEGSDRDPRRGTSEEADIKSGKKTRSEFNQ